MRRPRTAQKDSKQTIGDHRTGAILAPPSALYGHPIVKFLPDLVSFKKSSYQTGATKSGKILSCKFFFDLAKLLVVFVGFLMYIRFHLLSASSVVFGFFAQPIITTVGGIFVRQI
jgi:hypothetical protein